MNEKNRSDVVSILELITMIRPYKWLMLALPIATGALAALLVFMVIRPAWEASAILEIGQIGQVLQTGQIGQVLQTGQVGQVSVEPITNIVPRMSHPSFVIGALNHAVIKPEEMNEARAVYIGTLKVNPIKGSELVEVKLRAHSAEMARNLIQGSIVNLQQVHSKMMSITIDRINNQLQILNKDILELNNETELLRKKLFASHNWNAFDATLSATVLQNKSSQLRDMIQSKMKLEEQVSPSHTFITRVVGDVYVSEEPVSPNKTLIIGLSMLLGLLGAVLIALAHSAITSSAHRAKS